MKKAMIMAAGVGSRLNPITLSIPKPLVTVANIPIMDILFKNMKKHEITDVIANTHYMAEKIISGYENNNFGVNFSYIKEETLSGTAGGLKKCQHFFKDGENFFVLSADGLFDVDLTDLYNQHIKNNTIATIVVKEIPKNQVEHFGVVVTDEKGLITEFQEKPPVEEAKSNLINTGIYVFNYKIFDYIPENEFYDFAKNVFPKLLSEKQISAFKTSAYWSDIGTIEQYIESNFDVLNGKIDTGHTEIVKTEYGRYISESPLNNAVCIDSVIVGKDCKIGKNVTLENTILLDNVTISDNITLKNCLVSYGITIDKNIQNEVIA
ncbi:NDP-sugar synthase [bacterium]|nr:NDP-sugar synthase [bacterium]